MSQREWSERHLEVLGVALELIAAKGIRGTSLRDIAGRLGISQPSLYHYFKSKEELIEQIIAYCGANMVPMESPPQELEQLPRYVVRSVVDLWDRSPLHERFTRFLFSVALESPQHRGMLRELFDERLRVAGLWMAREYIERGELTEEEAEQLGSVLARSVGLLLIEQRILFDSRDDDKVWALCDFVAEMAVHMIRARRPVPRVGKVGKGEQP